MQHHTNFLNVVAAHPRFRNHPQVDNDAEMLPSNQAFASSVLWLPEYESAVAVQDDLKHFIDQENTDSSHFHDTMAHPLVWPTRYYFYPIGNTSAVSFTRDLPLEEPATILSLGCGDIRNVLYTIFMEHSDSKRSLDFTCCDLDPGVLARNALLFSLLADNAVTSDVIWNIYLHMQLDKSSYAILKDQCRKLVDLSDTVKNWNSSPYGRFIRMSTDYTLSELRRHWTLYAGMEDLSQARKKTIDAAFRKLKAERSSEKGLFFTSTRSSGPLAGKALKISSEQYVEYWKTGTTFTNPKDIAAATMLNPTFVYCRVGEGCLVHYGTDPLVPFHLAAFHGNNKGKATIANIVKAAKAEFSQWCTAFRSFYSSRSSDPPLIRYILADALAICHALHTFTISGNLNSGIPIAPWNTHLLRLSKEEYVTRSAPTTFNVIDTSNLDDHVGLLNVLVSVIPVLSSSFSNVVYTESLLSGLGDATKAFKERLYAEIPVISVLTGLCPLDYISGLSSRSNTHELVLTSITKQQSPQFHQVTTWKPPTTGDVIIGSMGSHPFSLSFDSKQLGKVLYSIYHSLFEQEDAFNFWRLNLDNMLKAVQRSNVIHYTRESFVLVLKLVKERNQIPDGEWSDVMDRFFEIHETDQSIRMDTLAHHDLYIQLYRHGLYKAPYYHNPVPKIGPIFSQWDRIPPIIRIVFSVPREKLQILGDKADRIGTPPLHCDITGSWSLNNFTLVNAGFGKVIRTGTKSDPRVIVEEDPLGWTGTLPLVLSFSLPAFLLVEIEPPHKLKVCLSVRSTSGAVNLTSALGPGLKLFTADLLDENHVHVLPDEHFSIQKPVSPASEAALWKENRYEQMGKPSNVVVSFDERCENVAMFTARFSVDNEAAQALFRSGATPNVSQLSPCTMRVVLGDFNQTVVFPFPVAGSQHKLRLARKSSYMEVVAPPSGPFKPEGMNLYPFPVVRAGTSFNSWSLHRINVARSPSVNLQTPDLEIWLNSHIGSMMSARERTLRKKDGYDPLMCVKDSIHSIFVRACGLQRSPVRRCFSLRDRATENCDTVIFVSDIKYDLQCHTFFVDGYVLPLTHELLPKIEKEFGRLIYRDRGAAICSVLTYEDEMRAWKYLLPALAERCRAGWEHKAQCEYIVQGKVPLHDVMEMDPLCSCGRGKNVEAMLKDPFWKPLAPHATRIALSPLFAVSYLETVLPDPPKDMCHVCRGTGKPKLMECSKCKKVCYCSRECQKKDWAQHKKRCHS